MIRAERMARMKEKESRDTAEQQIQPASISIDKSLESLGIAPVSGVFNVPVSFQFVLRSGGWWSSLRQETWRLRVKLEAKEEMGRRKNQGRDQISQRGNQDFCPW